MRKVDVTVDELTEDGVDSYAIKISSEFVELNVVIPCSEIQQLRDAHTIPWGSGAIRLGTSAGANVYWSAGDAGTLSVLVGHDDQTWDIGLTLPADVISMIFSGLPSSSGGG
jgi:hypothetical protein